MPPPRHLPKRGVRLPLPRLEIRPLAGFLALRPGTACDDLDRLAADCVRGFDHLRAPSLEADLARLRGLGLTANQEAMQVAWGYPFVFDEFRFHITLTDRLEAAERQRAHQALAPFVDPICAEPQMVDAICIFEQRNVGDPFRITKRFAFHP